MSRDGFGWIRNQQHKLSKSHQVEGFKGFCYIAGIFLPTSLEARIHWLFCNHVTSNNATVSRQRPMNG